MTARMTATALLLVLALASVGCSRAALMMQPQPFPANPNPSVTHQAILAGMSQRGWFPESQGQGQVIARLDIRSHAVRVLIRYDASWIQMSYYDSSNLDYHVRGNQAYIHRHYNTWVRNLANDINQALHQMAGPGVIVQVQPTY